MQKVRPTKTDIQSFFKLAVIDPNKPGNYLEQQIVQEGQPSYFETRVVEFMAEARRIREKIKVAKSGTKVNLIESYVETMVKAATALAIAAGKIDDTPPAETAKRTRSGDTRQDSPVSSGEGMGS